MTTMPEYTSIRATVESADVLRNLVIDLASKTRKRVTLMDALTAVITYSSRHVDDVAAVLMESES